MQFLGWAIILLNVQKFCIDILSLSKTNSSIYSKILSTVFLVSFLVNSIHLLLSLLFKIVIIYIIF